MLFLVRLELLQARDLARDHEIIVLAQRDAMLGSEAFRAFADKIDVRAFAQNFARGAHRVGNALDATHAASAKRGALP